jgi:putative ABC transport system permease protein
MNLPYLAARNVLRNKGRTIWTIVGVVVALLAFMLLRTVLTSWNEATEYGAKDRLAIRNKISFIIPLPRNYVDKIKAVPGVGDVTWMNWFGAKDPKDEKDFFATIATDPTTALEVYDDFAVPEDQKQAWFADRQGALIGKSLAKSKGWKIGDTVTLRGTIFPGDWKFTIRAIYSGTKKGTDERQFMFHWDYLNESLPADATARRDKIGWVIVKVKDPRNGASIGAAIDKTFEDSDNATLTQSELALNRSFMAMFDAILKAMNIVSIVILAIMTLILGNTIAMGVRERTSEYGVLRAIGFLPRHVAMFILGEAATIGILGGAFGVVFGTLVVNLFGSILEENMAGFFPSFKVAPATIALAFVLAIALGVIASAVPAYRAARLSVIDALRRVG